MAPGQGQEALSLSPSPLPLPLQEVLEEVRAERRERAMLGTRAGYSREYYLKDHH